MSSGFYRPSDNFFASIHPVSKLLALVLAFVPPFLGDSPQSLLPYFILLLAGVLLARAATALRRVYKIMLILFVMSMVLWTWFHPGRTVWLSLGPMQIMKESLLYGMTVGFRLNCFILATVIFLSTTPIEDFTFALRKLGLPFAPSFALTLAFRLTPLFIETGRNVAMAQKARGLDLDRGGPLTRIRKHAPIIVPVLIGGLRRGDQLAMALETRGFGRSGRRTHLTDHKTGWRDAVLFCVIIAVGLLML